MATHDCEFTDIPCPYQSCKISTCDPITGCAYDDIGIEGKIQFFTYFFFLKIATITINVLMNFVILVSILVFIPMLPVLTNHVTLFCVILWKDAFTHL